MPAAPELHFLRNLFKGKLTKDRQPVIWLLALFIGIGVGYAVLGLRIAIDFFTNIAFSADEESLLEATRDMAPWAIVLAPTLGGLVVGFLLAKVVPENRAGGVADIIEARAIRSGRLSVRHGLWSALIAAMSIGSGASTGREGPAAHLGASLASGVAQALNYPPAVARTLLGAGAAAAVAASFNAPIAGVLFALEVVLGHYALRAFGPIVIASVASVVVTRIYFSDIPAFFLPSYSIKSLWEMPAFAILGALSAVVAVLFMRLAMLTEDGAKKVPVPLLYRPAIGGFFVGLIALAYPQVLGVGYEATSTALVTGYSLSFLIACIAAKMIATSVSLAARFGGGVFAPSLFLGAMVGSAFGIVATGFFPEQSSLPGAYALVGMGAVAAATLGAPISTTLIVFELVQDYRLTIALLIAASISTVLTQSILGRSFFHWQIERRGWHVDEGPQKVLLETMVVGDLMAEGEAATRDEEGKALPVLLADDKLERAFALFEKNPATRRLAVVSRANRDEVIGVLDYTSALDRFTKALIEANIEEHR